MQVKFITDSSPVSDMNMHLYSEIEQPIGDVLDFFPHAWIIFNAIF